LTFSLLDLINAVISGELAARFREEGVAAYVDLVQNKERRLGLDILTHQKWFAVSFCALRLLTK
jgi:isocitrate lyase